MADRWKAIDTALKDGKPIWVKRVHDGRIVYEGLATWRNVKFDAMHDPISGDRFAEAADEIGWMYPDIDKRVPEPTHWLP